MPRGPKGERRPDDPAAAAVLALRISLGEAEETLDATRAEKDPAAVALGKRGGLKGGNERTRRLTPERRKEIAKLAASVRWKSNDKQHTEED
jgi:hypothetical protein